jgi:hypothetical protein
MAVTVLNGGGGLAKGVTIVLVASDHVGKGHVGFLQPGQQANFAFLVPGDRNAQAVVFARDQLERSYAWNLKGERRRFRRNKRKPFRTDQQIFRHFYPETDIDALAEVAALRAESGFRPTG